MNDNNSLFTPLSKLGKNELVEHLTKKYVSVEVLDENQSKKTINLLNFNAENIATSNVLLIEGVHFDLSYVPLKHLGFKTVVSCISEIYGMNHQPEFATVTIAVSNRFGLEALEDLFEGIHLGCKTYGVELKGIDITSSNKGMILNMTTFTDIDEQQLIKTSTANEGDLILVTGDLGAAYLGLQVLEREKAVFQVNPNSQPDLSAYTYLVQRQLKPSARKDMLDLFSALELKPTAMTAMKDGLASELQHISKNAALGFKIYEEKMPLDPETIKVCEEFQLNPMTVVLNGGEDYELLFTIKQDDYSKIKGNPNLTVIGHMIQQQEGDILINKVNQQIDLSKNQFHK